jgi:hypothetical protein
MASPRWLVLALLLLCCSVGQAKVAEEDVTPFDDYEDTEDAKRSVKEPVATKPKRREEENPDDDDFEGATVEKPVKAPRKKISFGPTETQNYYMEYAALVFIAVYAVNFLLGSRNNNRIAQNWYQHYEDWFKTQFASTGPLLKDSHFSYKFYASGRRYCTGMLVTMNLRKRHDLFSLMMEAGGASEDSIIIEIPMMEDDMEPFVFAISRKKAEKKMKKNNKDLDNLSLSVKSRLLGDSLALLTDTPDLEAAFLDERSCRTMSLEWFRSLHFSDLGAVKFNASTKVLRFQFRLPDDVTQLRVLTEMAIFFVDRVATTKLSATVKQKNILKRKQVAEKEFKASHQQRQEAAAKRKEERKEESPADAKAAAKKKEAKDKKAKQPRVKVLR